ncbi:MAG: hypothetical protein BAJALOKI2v1_520020 [Promethearchaeota archaeon]|nr:MAG: hypothetical protein BAJALOKI2v1_520020 [Candidatus Lokiarchaeota archaeon]
MDMSDKSDLEIEKEADNLEIQAKEEIKNRNYNHAIELLEKAKQLNGSLGYQGQVGIIEKKISRVKNLIKFEAPKEDKPHKDFSIREKEGDRLLNTARKYKLEKNYKQALKFYEDAFKVFDDLHFTFQCDKIRTEINSMKKKIGMSPISKNLIETHTPDAQDSENKEFLTFDQQKKKQQREKRERLKKFKEQKEKEKELFNRAEELLDKGNHCLKEKEFKDAKFFYKKSMEIFKQMGWEGQAEIIEKELSNINKYKKDYENILKEKSVKSKEIDDHVEKIASTEDKGKLGPNSNKANLLSENTDPERQRLLEEARLRRNQLRLKTEKSIGKEKEIEYRNELINEREEKRKQITRKQEQELKKTKEKKKKEDFLLNQANRKLDQGKRLVDNKEFEKAKTLYREALDIFKTLGWFNQVDTLYDEIKNIERYKVEHLAKLKVEERRKKKEEEQFNKRVKEMISEKEKQERERAAQMESLPPSLQKDLQKAKLLLDKAEKERAMGKLQRVKGRYEYVLKIYNKIPKEKLDLSEDIKDLEKRISHIESKM